jgi:hypothetical protein
MHKFALHNDGWRHVDGIGWLCQDHNVCCAHCDKEITPRLDGDLLYDEGWRWLRGAWAGPLCVAKIPTYEELRDNGGQHDIQTS